MAGVLRNPLATKMEYTGDANDLLTNGIYSCESGVTNVPAAISYLICMSAGRAYLNCLQICVDHKNRNAYMRTNWNGNWTDWKEISFI